MILHLPLAAEVEVGDLRVAYGPTAIVRQERVNRLSLTDRNFQVVVRHEHGWALICIHEES